MPRGPAVYTVGRQLGDGQMYIFSLFDLEPAGILVIVELIQPYLKLAYCLISGRCATDSGLLPSDVKRIDNVAHGIGVVFGCNYTLAGRFSEARCQL